MRMSLSAEGVACTMTRQKAGRVLKTPAAPAIQGGSSTGSLNAPAGTVSALMTFAWGGLGLASSSQGGSAWASATKANAAERNSVVRNFFMICASTKREKHNT